MTAVVGDKEANAATLPVRMRDGSIVDMTVEQMDARIREATEGWPRLPLPTRSHLTRRFPFRG